MFFCQMSWQIYSKFEEKKDFNDFGFTEYLVFILFVNPLKLKSVSHCWVILLLTSDKYE